MLINLQCCVLWAHTDVCWVQPSSQITRELLGDEAGPRLTQEVSLQAGAWDKGISGQQHAWLSWRAGLVPSTAWTQAEGPVPGAMNRCGRDAMSD